MRKAFLVSCFLALSPTPQALAQDLLQPTVTQPGTAEENGIITTLALTYVKVRNTVRDAYLSIQYTKGMIQTLDDQKEWVRRNLKGWDHVRNRVVRLVSEPGQWDNKLIEMEKIFDKTDYLLWEESKAFDDLMYRQERYMTRIGQHGQAILDNHPYVAEFYKFNASLYRADPGYVATFKGASPELDEIHKASEVQRLEAARVALASTSEGRVRDATILAASRAQAQIAALRRMQKERAARFQASQDILKGSTKVNAQELGRTLLDLKGLEGDLDGLALRRLELELLWAQFGTQIFELSQKRASEIRSSFSAADLAAALSN